MFVAQDACTEAPEGTLMQDVQSLQCLSTTKTGNCPKSKEGRLVRENQTPRKSTPRSCSDSSPYMSGTLQRRNKRKHAPGTEQFLGSKTPKRIRVQHLFLLAKDSRNWNRQLCFSPRILDSDWSLLTRVSHSILYTSQIPWKYNTRDGISVGHCSE